MIEKDGFADPGDETSFRTPDTNWPLENLRPLVAVFPKQQADLITRVAEITLYALETRTSEDAEASSSMIS
jgi:hypothetical protein